MYRPEQDIPTRIIKVKKIRAGQVTKKDFQKVLNITRQQYNLEMTRLMSNVANSDLLEFFDKSNRTHTLPLRIAERIASRLFMESIRIEKD